MFNSRAPNRQIKASGQTKDECLASNVIWHISGTNKYFFGSIHLLPQSDSYLGDTIWSLLPKMRRIVFESDFSTMTEPDFVCYPNGQSLMNDIPEDLYEQCRQRWSELGIQKNMDSYKPWRAAQLIAIVTALKNGGSLELGADKQIFTKTTANQREFLEGTEVLRAFDSAPLSEQISYLRMCSSNSQTVIADYMKIFNAWRASDIEALSAIFEQKISLMPEIFTALVPNRNRIWTPKILQFLADSEPTLFVLGALHYVGANSLPDCLAKPHGYYLSAISS